MSVVAVLRLPLAVDLSGFVKLLQRMQVPHRVSEEAGEQVLWVPDEISEDVRSLYARFSRWRSRPAVGAVRHGWHFPAGGVCPATDAQPSDGRGVVAEPDRQCGHPARGKS
nr:hypothetical protein GCM10020185_69480 [Pseudomonas brassicacearum subsp. brassicacearum]